MLREHARNTVLKALRNITTGKTLPEDIHPLVLRRWPTLMYNHYLSHGKENDEWITIIEVLRDIVESVQPINTAEELAQLLANRDQLIETALTYLNKTNQSKKDVEAVINGLKSAHQTHIDSADFSEDEIEAGMEAQAAELEEQLEQQAEAVTAEPEPVEEEPTGPALPPGVTPGMWFQVYIGEDKANRRGKLSVIITDDAKLVFVNYQGEIIVEKSFEEFGDELEQGLSAVIMGHSVFDHALNRVVSKLSPLH